MHQSQDPATAYNTPSSAWRTRKKALGRKGIVCFAVQRLTADTMVPIELFGEPWVLFRDDTGAAACVRDECAHRACPLSLGAVVDGRVQCAYHGCAICWPCCVR